ncbi:MAG: NTP transferase domain-containing protein, partial [Phycisphaeraceae bacterium]|nr:NTP transferase domain-containing protein [Phycisphaeraceae bacterium]
MPDNAPTAIILAAGKGTRMGADTAKVLLPAGGRPMVRWVWDACRDAGINEIVLVVGHAADEVRSEFADESRCHFAVQQPQLGTGHAVMVTRSVLDQIDPPEV